MIIHPQGKWEKWILRFEGVGNSIALYLLLGIICLSVWQLSPLPSPDWSPSGTAFGFAALIFIGLTSLHGILWWILTREFLPLTPVIKRFLSSSIRLVRPLHMMTGMVGLGLAIFHAIAFLSLTMVWNGAAITGIIGLVTLVLLAIDGIGLMVSPFLSRAVHRWIALVFLVVTVIHLVIVL
ncbi:hypothetical protein [Ammoniphilus sp. CFH 90114]|uniref:hypothetical protein n=1 Tax=Ammoniphilus sp. CFH 90114 TaxID=2493665 RepID=UPI00100DA3F2|nr:hypothetical protein [Ammoniphilus sp. CFH 90114]RXT07891.1 hypothetical protein EIZ39_10740 [Ammoniphilus sp. CFH 90114]